MKLLPLLTTIWLFPLLVLAQQEAHFLTVGIANDLFFQTDRYYTSGIGLQYQAPSMNQSTLLNWLLFSRNAPVKNTGFTIVQDIFTPRRLRPEVFQPNDRPYTAYLMAGFFRAAAYPKKNIRLITSIQAGTLGPYALGEVMQTAVHSVVPAVAPQGWDFQLSPAFLLQYSITREQALVSNSNFHCIWATGAEAGLLRIKSGTGFTLRTGKLLPPFQQWIQPQPGNYNNDDRVQFFLFTSPSADVTGYDATFQGGYFGLANRYALAKGALHRFNFQVASGISLLHPKFGFRIWHTYRTPEFVQATSHNWLNIDLHVRW